MTRTKYAEIKFYKTKYKIFKIKTLEHIYYDILLYEKRGMIWVNNKIKNDGYYLRFDSFDDVIKFIFK
jgi:hypothetical protein